MGGIVRRKGWVLGGYQLLAVVKMKIIIWASFLLYVEA